MNGIRGGGEQTVDGSGRKREKIAGYGVKGNGQGGR